MFRRCIISVLSVLFLFISFTLSSAESWQDPTTDMKFARINGGCFKMGQVETEKRDLERLRSAFTSRANFGDELPRHEVCVSDYYLGVHEVTVGAYRIFVEETGYLTEAEKGGGCMEYPIPGYRWIMKDLSWKEPGFEKKQKDNEPVVCISHNDAVEYAGWLSKKDGRRNYRLPTEAEWEFAAREGGSDKQYGSSEDLGETGWYVENSPRRTSPVGTRKATIHGINDLNGNVWEWTGDTYGKGYYGKSPRQDPEGMHEGLFKVVRGGGWNSFVWHCRAANREHVLPEHRDTSIGFRLVFTE